MDYGAPTRVPAALIILTRQSGVDVLPFGSAFPVEAPPPPGAILHKAMPMS